MKTILKLTLAAFLLFGSTTLMAQKMGRVNLQEIIAEMPELTEMQSNFEAFQNDLVNNLQIIEVEFNNKLADYQKNEATLSESVKQLRQKELNDLRTRYQEFQQNIQVELQNKYAELMQPIINKAREAVKQISTGGGFTVVFDISNTGGIAEYGALAFFNETEVVDLDPQVKKQLGI